MLLKWKRVGEWGHYNGYHEYDGQVKGRETSEEEIERLIEGQDIHINDICTWPQSERFCTFRCQFIK